MDQARTPEEYLEEIRRAERAKLTIYVGFAAGVGKTYKMLADAHELERAGVDVGRRVTSNPTAGRRPGP